MKQKGWIKLHRSLIEWEWWDDHNATRLLIYLLCSVNHEPKKWKGITIEPGSMVLSWAKLSERSFMSVKQCRIAMEKLERCGEVTRNTTNKYQLVTLTKWDDLQIELDEVASKTANKGQAKGKQRATTKECKNERNNKSFHFVQRLIEIGVEKNIVDDWMKVRKNKKATNTETAFNRIENEIKKSGLTANECIKIAVEHSWSGFQSSWLKNLNQKDQDDETRIDRIANW